MGNPPSQFPVKAMGFAVEHGKWSAKHLLQASNVLGRGLFAVCVVGESMCSVIKNIVDSSSLITIGRRRQ